MKSLTTTTLLLLLPLGHGFSAEDVLQVVVEESSSSSSSSTLQGRLKPQSHLHRGRQLQTAACTEEMAQDLQSVATENQQLSRQGLSMDCSCVYAESESDIVIREAVVSCIIDRGQDCEVLQCRDGWNCGTTTSSNLNSTQQQQQDDAVVEVCQNITEEQLWVVPERNVYNRVVVRDRRVFVRGVKNIASRQVQVNREDGTCVYSVDDEPCNSCQICPFSNVAVANCTNLIPNATVTCEDEEGILVKLLELDSAANYSTTTANFAMDDDDNPNLLDSSQEVDPDDEFFDIETTDNRLGRSASAAAAVGHCGGWCWLASVLVASMGSIWI